MAVTPAVLQLGRITNRATYSTTLETSRPPPTRPKIQSIVWRAQACNHSLVSAYRASSRVPKTMGPVLDSLAAVEGD